MSRGLRLIPIILLLWLVSTFAWRLIKPADPAVRSQLVERTLPLPNSIAESVLHGKKADAAPVGAQPAAAE